MSGFFDRMLGRNNENKGSSSKAKDRLKFVLLHERVSITPEKMREMKEEIIAVIAKYVPGIDPNTVDVAIEQTDRYDNKLIAEIPFTKSRGLPAVDIDGNDDLEIDEGSELLNAEPAAPQPYDDDGFEFTDDDTSPNPALQLDLSDEAGDSQESNSETIEDTEDKD